MKFGGNTNSNADNEVRNNTARGDGAGYHHKQSDEE
jgi:hypothetical protein